MADETWENTQPTDVGDSHSLAGHAEAGEDLVRLVGVHKAFGNLHVLRGVDLNFRKGETTVILGPSGTGKSVLLKHIVGLLRPDQGEVYFKDERVDRMSPEELVEMRKQVGYLFQMGALFDSMNVEQNVCFPLLEHGNMSVTEQKERAARVLEMVGLAGTQKKMPNDLSGGQRKRVALARAVVLGPCLVLYDEPTTGLDPIRADLINELIIALGDRLGITSIVVTHDMTSANKIADRMVLLYDGHIVCDGKPEQFRQTENQLVQRFIHGRADEEDLRAIREGFERVQT